MSTEGLMGQDRPPVGNRSLLRRMNTLGLLDQLHDGPKTSAELVETSGLSRTAVDGVLEDLLRLGWIEMTDAPAGRLGRPASRAGLASTLGVQVSVDIGANHLRAVISALHGPPGLTRVVPVSPEDSAESRLHAAARLVQQLLTDQGRDLSELWILTVGSPGSITDGVVRHYGGAGLPGWTGLDLAAWFGEAFRVAVVIEGDVALGAEAELAWGAAQGKEDVVYVLSGVRTSGALIINGRLHRGVHGAAGIVGELPQLQWSKLESSWTADPGNPHGTGLDREGVFAAARAGDAAAVAAARSFADNLATGSAALVLAVDPELLIIGGGSTPGADVFLPRFTETLARLCPSTPQIAVSRLGSDAVALGGISLGRRRLHAILATAVREGDAFPSPDRTRSLLRA